MARYKTFAGPFAKVFLGAIFTYQVIYWTWLKLEMDESKVNKNRTSHAYASYRCCQWPWLTHLQKKWQSWSPRPES